LHPMSGRDYQIHTFANGLRLVHKRVSGTRLAHIGYVIHAGSRHDGEHPGLAHCFEHMMFKGTAKRKAIHVLNRLETVGGELNAFTTKEITSVYASVTTAHFRRAAELLTDVIYASVFPEHELKKEKQVICEEINLYLDTPEENIYDEFQELVYRSHPMATNILGTPAHVNALKPEHLRKFRSNYYGTQNTVISVVGNISLSRAVKTLEPLVENIPLYGNGTGIQVPFSGYRPEKKEIQTEFVQGYAILGCPAYAANDSRRHALILLNNLLGGPGLNSRLNLAIREKYGFTYNVESGYAAYTDTGLFHCYVSSDKQHLARAVELIEKELKKLMEKPLGTVQLHNARNQLCGQIVMSDESRSGLMLHLGKNIVQYGKADTLSQVLAKIQGITSAELQEIARDIFHVNRLSYLRYLPA
jgi:predicted Zn-dependent peptidase